LIFNDFQFYNWQSRDETGRDIAFIYNKDKGTLEVFTKDLHDFTFTLSSENGKVMAAQAGNSQLLGQTVMHDAAGQAFTKGVSAKAIGTTLIVPQTLSPEEQAYVRRTGVSVDNATVWRQLYAANPAAEAVGAHLKMIPALMGEFVLGRDPGVAEDRGFAGLPLRAGEKGLSLSGKLVDSHLALFVALETAVTGKPGYFQRLRDNVQAKMAAGQEAFGRFRDGIRGNVEKLRDDAEYVLGKIHSATHSGRMEGGDQDITMWAGFLAGFPAGVVTMIVDPVGMLVDMGVLLESTFTADSLRHGGDNLRANVTDYTHQVLGVLMLAEGARAIWKARMTAAAETRVNVNVLRDALKAEYKGLDKPGAGSVARNVIEQVKGKTYGDVLKNGKDWGLSDRQLGVIKTQMLKEALGWKPPVNATTQGRFRAQVEAIKANGLDLNALDRIKAAGRENGLSVRQMEKSLDLEKGSLKKLESFYKQQLKTPVAEALYNVDAAAPSAHLTLDVPGRLRETVTLTERNGEYVVDGIVKDRIDTAKTTARDILRMDETFDQAHAIVEKHRPAIEKLQNEIDAVRAEIEGVRKNVSENGQPTNQSAQNTGTGAGPGGADTQALPNLLEQEAGLKARLSEAQRRLDRELVNALSPNELFARVERQGRPDMRHPNGVQGGGAEGRHALNRPSLREARESWRKDITQEGPVDYFRRVHEDLQILKDVARETFDAQLLDSAQAFGKYTGQEAAVAHALDTALTKMKSEGASVLSSDLRAQLMNDLSRLFGEDVRNLDSALRDYAGALEKALKNGADQAGIEAAIRDAAAPSAHLTLDVPGRLRETVTLTEQNGGYAVEGILKNRIDTAKTTARDILRMDETFDQAHAIVEKHRPAIERLQNEIETVNAKIREVRKDVPSRGTHEGQSAQNAGTNTSPGGANLETLSHLLEQKKGLEGRLSESKLNLARELERTLSSETLFARLRAGSGDGTGSVVQNQPSIRQGFSEGNSPLTGSSLREASESWREYITAERTKGGHEINRPSLREAGESLLANFKKEGRLNFERIHDGLKTLKRSADSTFDTQLLDTARAFGQYTGQEAAVAQALDTALTRMKAEGSTVLSSDLRAQLMNDLSRLFGEDLKNIDGALRDYTGALEKALKNGADQAGIEAAIRDVAARRPTPAQAEVAALFRDLGLDANGRGLTRQTMVQELQTDLARLKEQGYPPEGIRECLGKAAGYVGRDRGVALGFESPDVLSFRRMVEDGAVGKPLALKAKTQGGGIPAGDAGYMADLARIDPKAHAHIQSGVDHGLYKINKDGFLTDSLDRMIVPDLDVFVNVELKGGAPPRLSDPLMGRTTDPAILAVQDFNGLISDVTGKPFHGLRHGGLMDLPEALSPELAKRGVNVSPDKPVIVGSPEGVYYPGTHAELNGMAQKLHLSTPDWLKRTNVVEMPAADPAVGAALDCVFGKQLTETGPPAKSLGAAAPADFAPPFSTDYEIIRPDTNGTGPKPRYQTDVLQHYDPHAVLPNALKDRGTPAVPEFPQRVLDAARQAESSQTLPKPAILSDNVRFGGRIKNWIFEKLAGLRADPKPVGVPFDPSHPSGHVQIGVDPRTLRPVKDLNSLDQQRLANAEKFARDQSIEVNRRGEVLQGHHRLKNAIDHGRVVDVVIVGD